MIVEEEEAVINLTMNSQANKNIYLEDVEVMTLEEVVE